MRLQGYGSRLQNDVVQEERDLLHNTAGVPMSLLSLLNAKAEMMAPAFPAAAEIPCANARNRVGKTSAG